MNAAVIAILVEKGLTAADILAVAEALETRKDRTGAERQARYRARHKVTRDVTRDDSPSPLAPPPNPPPNPLKTPPPISPQPDEAAPHLRATRHDTGEAFAFWNSNAEEAGWPTIRTVSDARRKFLVARLREHGLDGWKAGITRARASPYLGGADPPDWFTFDWIVKSANFLKLIEGNYDRNRNDRRQPSGWEAAYIATGGQDGTG